MQPSLLKTGGSKQWEKYNDGFVPQAQITAAPTAAEVRQQIAQIVAQAPPSQQQSSQPTMLPIPLQQTTQQQEPSVVPSTSGGVASGPTIPMLPTSDPNNFLVLYSKMVYNIVDG